MLIDREQILTPLAGQLFDPGNGSSEYGSAAYDLKATTYGGNPAIAEPLDAFFRVMDADVDNLTSLTFEVVADDDGAGTNEVSLISKTVVLANLTTAKGTQRIGTLDPSKSLAATNQYLTAKVTQTGSNPTQGKIQIWLQKPGTDTVPAHSVSAI